ncbi:MAG: hypothetical protein FIB00_07570 [Chloroflexi bacterium]|nr:hypothetical protein [Chloroflexota bacterium]PWB42764.1 MAG: hypothetical protein C3F10_13615 [Dehalococcoidia bacterium]
MLKTPALIALMLLVGMVFAACQDETLDDQVTGTATASPPPPATATPGGGQCPVAVEICDFSAALQRLISAADINAIEALMSSSEFVCPGAESGAGGPFPLCDGAREGEVRQGFRIRRLQSDGGTVEYSLLPQLRMAILDDADQYLGYYVEPHVIGIHCPVVSGSPECGEQFIVYFSMAMPSANAVVERRPEGLRLVGLQMGDALEKPGAIASHRGDLPYFGDRVGPGWFYPWRGEYLPDPEHDVPRRWLFAPPELSGVTVRPPSGPCPATLTLTLSEAPSSAPGKEPLPRVWIIAGTRGIQHTVGIPGRPPLVVQDPPWLPDGRSAEVRLEPGMLNGTLCDARTITLIAWGGPDGPVVAGYAIEP